MRTLTLTNTSGTDPESRTLNLRRPDTDSDNLRISIAGAVHGGLDIHPDTSTYSGGHELLLGQDCDGTYVDGLSSIKRRGGWVRAHYNDGFYPVIDGMPAMVGRNGVPYFVDTPDAAEPIVEACLNALGREPIADTTDCDLAYPPPIPATIEVRDLYTGEHVEFTAPWSSETELSITLAIDGVQYGSLKFSTNRRHMFTITMMKPAVGSDKPMTPATKLTRLGGWVLHTDDGYLAVVDGKPAFDQISRSDPGWTPLAFATEQQAAAVVKAELFRQRRWFTGCPIDVVDKRSGVVATAK